MYVFRYYTSIISIEINFILQNHVQPDMGFGCSTIWFDSYFRNEPF